MASNWEGNSQARSGGGVSDRGSAAHGCCRRIQRSGRRSGRLSGTRGSSRPSYRRSGRRIVAQQGRSCQRNGAPTERARARPVAHWHVTAAGALEVSDQRVSAMQIEAVRDRIAAATSGDVRPLPSMNGMNRIEEKVRQQGLDYRRQAARLRTRDEGDVSRHQVRQPSPWRAPVNAADLGSSDLDMVGLQLGRGRSGDAVLFGDHAMQCQMSGNDSAALPGTKRCFIHCRAFVVLRNGSLPLRRHYRMTGRSRTAIMLGLSPAESHSHWLVGSSPIRRSDVWLSTSRSAGRRGRSGSRWNSRIGPPLDHFIGKSPVVQPVTARGGAEDAPMKLNVGQYLFLREWRPATPSAKATRSGQTSNMSPARVIANASSVLSASRTRCAKTAIDRRGAG